MVDALYEGSKRGLGFPQRYSAYVALPTQQTYLHPQYVHCKLLQQIEWALKMGIAMDTYQAMQELHQNGTMTIRVTRCTDEPERKSPWGATITLHPAWRSIVFADHGRCAALRLHGDGFVPCSVRP